MTGYEEVNEDAIAALRARAIAKAGRADFPFPWAVLVVYLLLSLWATMARAQMTPATVPQPALRLSPVLFVTRVEAPLEYARWYAAVERCVGMRGRYKDVRWYLAAKPWTGLTGPTYGMWQDGHRITLNAPERLDSALVSHEAMHDILAVNKLNDPDDAHPAAYFGEGKCVYRFHAP